MCPQPQFTGNFWTDLIIAETEGRTKPATHTSLSWLLQCSANGKRGLFSNLFPPHCCITKHTQNSLRWLPTLMVASPASDSLLGHQLKQWCVNTPAGNSRLYGMKHSYNSFVSTLYLFFLLLFKYSHLHPPPQLPTFLPTPPPTLEST